jgi:hypothetical protein
MLGFDSAGDLPAANPNLVMGAIFGGGHAAYGIYLHFTEKPGDVA